ncbi:hypothetical protein MKX01_016041 [Papaver californicum]|nr:hypothetical protein MKX01_016041 [Papaver californicum]
MFATVIRLCGKKPIEMNPPTDKTRTLTRVILDIVKEHGPLTFADTWDYLNQEVGIKGLTSKRHMKIVFRWMQERQKLRLICNHVGSQKQFLYTTWFTNPNIMKASKPSGPSKR